MAADLLLFRGTIPVGFAWQAWRRNAINPTSLTAFIHTCKEVQPLCFKWRHNALRNGFEEGHAFESASKMDVDKLLAVAEVVCIVPSLVLSVGCALQSTFQKPQNVYSATSTLPLSNRNGNMFITWQILPLLGAVIISAIIRTRQWHKITRAPSEGGGSDISLIQRVKKLEEDVGSSVTIIRVLSRQLEKLGVRFRVTRQTLRDPINQTAALAQKTSEAVRVLAMEEDALENELREIQYILLAMQEQQQKQLELVLALAKAGRLQEKPTHSSVQSIEKPDDSTGPGYSGRHRTKLKGFKEHTDLNNLAKVNFVQKPGQAEINRSQILEVQGKVRDIRSKSDFAASNSQEKNDNLNSHSKEKFSAEGSGL